MNNKKRIRGKVARILNSRELVINLGSEQGVVLGMCFDVLDPKGEDIKDPDTGDILGSLERPKVRVKVNRVEPKICVATTYKKIDVNIGGTGAVIPDLRVFSKLLMPPKWVANYETLKTEEKTWEDLSEKESYVKTGDPVIQVFDIDEEE